MKEAEPQLTRRQEAVQAEYREIHAALQNVRDSIVTAKDHDPESGEYTYNPRFNMVVYKELKKFEDARSPAYIRAKNELQASTRFDLETMLGERYHVSLSSYNLRKDTEGLKADNTEETMLSMYKRGRDFRKKHGKPVDWEREDAEVEGFEKVIEPTMMDENTPIGTMLVSISLPGRNGSTKETTTIYKNNFYDIFTKTAQGVEVRRYSSALKMEDYVNKLCDHTTQLSVHDKLTPEEMLRKPLRFDPKISAFKTPDDLHKYLHQRHEYVTVEEFAEIKRFSAGLVVSLLNTLAENPDDEEMILLTYNALLFTSDEKAAELQNRRKKMMVEVFSYRSSPAIPVDIYTRDEIRRLGRMPITQVMTGCGVSGGFNVPSSVSQLPGLSLLGPSSVLEFGKDNSSNQEWFTCPRASCGYKADGPIGNTCPECGLTKEEYAEETGIVCA